MIDVSAKSNTLRYAKAAGRLSKARAKAAKQLAKRVEGPLRDLALPDARFAVGLTPVAPPDGLPCGPSGAESVEFLFSANAGSEPRPLQRVASGGELSRVFLALKNALRGAGRGIVLIFDEVDAGIGGRVAERVGRCLAELGGCSGTPLHLVRRARHRRGVLARSGHRSWLGRTRLLLSRSPCECGDHGS